MKLFITGANGFIGSSLCRYFLALGWEVHGLVRSTSNLHNLEGLSVQLHTGDLRDPASFSIPVRDHPCHPLGLDRLRYGR